MQFGLCDVGEPVLEGVLDDAGAFLGRQLVNCLPGNRARVFIYRHVCVEVVDGVLSWLIGVVRVCV